MKRFLGLIGLAVTGMAAPALAQAPAGAAAAIATPAPTDPARLTAAKTTVNAIFPVGTYRRMLGGNLTRMMSGMTERMYDMPVRDMMKMGGAAEDELKPLSNATMRQVLEIMDPAFAERNRRMFDHMMAGMAEVMNGFEPEVRDALADAYAAKFTLPQLEEMNRFFATPTGRLYAENAMTLAMDPAFMDRMTKLMPRLMEAMPAIMKSATADMKDLPPRRTYAQLSAADRAKLSQVLGVSGPETEKVVNQLDKQQKRPNGAAQ